MRELFARLARRGFPPLIFLVVLTGGFLLRAEAATVTLLWDSNRESDVAGYLVSFGTQSGQLTDTIDVGNHTSYQVTNLEVGLTYFFAVRAYTTAGVTSPPSAEVSARIGTAGLSLTNLVASLTPPRPVGTKVIFAAAASGGTPPYQYEWFVSDGLKLTLVRGWSDDNTFSWQPQTKNTAYSIKARARSAPTTDDGPENPWAERSMAFAITSADFTVIHLVSDRLPPQPAASQILFTASASGGSSTYQFQWSVFDGTSWKVLRDWSTDSKWTWRPGAPNPKYQVMVRVRGGRNLAANASLVMPFPIQ